MDFSSIQSAVSGLQTIASMAKSLLDIRDAGVIKEKVSIGKLDVVALLKDMHEKTQPGDRHRRAIDNGLMAVE